MARIYPICSSSAGNCTFIGTRGHGVLVDAGCSFRAIKSALELIDTPITGIEALFITHEHIDHIKGVAQLMKHTKIPVFASSGTIAAMMSDNKNPLPEGARLYDIFKDGYKSADFDVSAFHTPHDTPESCGYVISYSGHRISVCTDIGHITEEISYNLRGCDCVLLESNYDHEMLSRNINYPPYLKERISSKEGHLSNTEAAEFCEELVRSGTRHIILGHLSRENNTPAIARSAVESHLSRKGLRCEQDYTLNVAPIHTEGLYIAI